MNFGRQSMAAILFRGISFVDVASLRHRQDSSQTPDLPKEDTMKPATPVIYDFRLDECKQGGTTNNGYVPTPVGQRNMANYKHTTLNVARRGNRKF